MSAGCFNLRTKRGCVRMGGKLCPNAEIHINYGGIEGESCYSIRGGTCKLTGARLSTGKNFGKFDIGSHRAKLW